MKSKLMGLVVVLMVVGTAVVVAQDEPAATEQAAAAPEQAQVGAKKLEFTTNMEKVSYAIGNQIGSNMRKGDLELEVDHFVAGLVDALEGREAALTQEQMQEAMQLFQQEMMSRREKKAQENLEEGQAFLEANKEKEGVKVTESGLQYQVIEEGTGKTPDANDRVKVHYKGTLLDGEQFDSSYDRGEPATFMVSGVIEGWTEALQMMKEGGKWTLWIPAGSRRVTIAARTSARNFTGPCGCFFRQGR